MTNTTGQIGGAVHDQGGSRPRGRPSALSWLALVLSVIALCLSLFALFLRFPVLYERFQADGPREALAFDFRPELMDDSVRTSAARLAQLGLSRAQCDPDSLSVDDLHLEYYGLFNDVSVAWEADGNRVGAVFNESKHLPTDVQLAIVKCLSIAEGLARREGLGAAGKDAIASWDRLRAGARE